MGHYAARDLVTVPGLLSLARLPLALLFPFAAPHPIAAVGVLALGAATDMLDGWYARRFHQETPTGAMLDGVMDKVFVIAVVGTLMVAERLSMIEAVLLGMREVGEAALIVYWAVVWRARHRSVRREANRLGKLATALQFSTVTALLVGAPHPELWLGATAVCGAVAALTYALREGRAYATPGQPPP